jgi:hypothetical protein
MATTEAATSNQWKNHGIAVAVFILLAIVYCLPMLQGKVLVQNDHVQGIAMSKQLQDLYEKTGELSLWSSANFSGMPAYMIFMRYTVSIMSHVGGYLSYTLPIPLNVLLISLFASYILFIVMRFDWRLAVIGSVAFTFCSYTMISIEAGHVSKILALAYAPLVVAGVMLVFRGTYLAGAAFTTLGTALQLYANHIQISYYLFLALAVYVLFEVVWNIRAGTLRHLLIAVLILGGSAIVATATRTSTLLLNVEYSKETIRGGSELKSNVQSKGGLDRDYAFNHSQGISETLTLLIPDLYGGSSVGALSDQSETYKVLTRNGVPANSAKDFVSRLPLYWGDQPFTSGPVYAGIVVVLFAVLGLWVSENRIKWWLLASTAWFIVLAWGSNFALFNDVMFDYFPAYNKFRAVTMIFGMVQLLLVTLALLGVQWLMEHANNRELLLSKAKPVFYVVGGLLVALLLLSGALFDYAGKGDEEFLASLKRMTGNDGFASQIIGALQEDRSSRMFNDTLRSLLWVVLSAVICYVFAIRKISAPILLYGIGAVVLIDVWGVDKRYFNNDNFVKPKEYSRQFAPTEADIQIKADTDPNFRVINTTVSTFNSALPSYHHKSIGGYHGAKLRRYQEIIERHISRNNMRVLNMLNTKYFIVQGENNQPKAIQNPDAYGHAWPVASLIAAADADDELSLLDSTDLRTTAVVAKSIVESMSMQTEGYDTGGTVVLTSFKENELVYSTQFSSDALVVFSEIYYRGNKDWISTIDDKPIEHFRANYILRAMKVPAGSHTIKFRFDPPSYSKGQWVDFGASIVVLGLVFAAVWSTFKGTKTEQS